MNAPDIAAIIVIHEKPALVGDMEGDVSGMDAADTTGGGDTDVSEPGGIVTGDADGVAEIDGAPRKVNDIVVYPVSVNWSNAWGKLSA